MEKAYHPDGITMDVSLLDELSHQTIALSGDYVTVNSQQFLFFSLSCHLGDFKKEIKRITLSFFENGVGSVTPVLYKTTSSGGIIGQGITLTSEIIDGNRLFTADLTSVLINNFEGMHYFALKSIQNISIYHSLFCANHPTVFFQTISVFDTYYHHYNDVGHFIDKIIGDDTLDVNLFTGGLKYTIGIFHTENLLFSFDLNLNYYSHLKGENSVGSLVTGLPRGYLFSFQQFLLYENSQYVYFDDNAQKHFFVTPINYNGDDLFFDSNGGYLLLKKYTDRYEVLLPNGNKSIFSLNGYLTKSTIKKGGTFVDLVYSYNSNNCITEIELSNNGANKTLLTISYNTNSILVKPFGENNANITLTTNVNGELSSITDGFGETYSFAYLNNSLVSISRYDLTVNFLYNLYDYLVDITKTISYDFNEEHFDDSVNYGFYYKSYTCIFTTYIENNALIKKEKLFEFDEDGNLIKSFFLENNSNVDGVEAFWHKHDQDYTLSSNAQIISDNVNSSGVIINYESNPTTISNNISTHTFYIKMKEINLISTLFLLVYNSSALGETELKIRILKGTNEYLNENICLKTTHKVSPVLIPIPNIDISSPDDNRILTIKIKKLSGSVSCVVAKIFALSRKGGDHYNVSNINDSSGGDEPFSLKTEDSFFVRIKNQYTISCGGISATYSLYYKDFLNTIISNEANHISGVFCNDGQVFIYQPSSINGVSLNQIKVGKLIFYPKVFFDQLNRPVFYSEYVLNTIEFDNANNHFVTNRIAYDKEADRRSVLTTVYDNNFCLVSKADLIRNETTNYTNNTYGQLLSSLLVREIHMGVANYQVSTVSPTIAYDSSCNHITSETHDIDDSASYSINYTYNAHFLMLSKQNSTNTFCDCKQDINNKNQMTKCYIYTNSYNIVSPTFLTYNADKLSSIYNNNSSAKKNQFTFGYFKNREVGIINWYNHQEISLDYFENSNDRLMSCHLHNFMVDYYDFYGRPFYINSFFTHSLNYYYRDRNQSLSDVMGEENEFNGNLKHDQVLGGELDNSTQLLISYEYDYLDNVSHIFCRDLNNDSGNEGDYVFYDDEYDCEISGGRESFDSYPSTTNSLEFTNCLHHRIEKTFNLFDTNKGLLKINTYYINNSEIEVINNLYFGPYNASQIYDQLVTVKDVLDSNDLGTHYSTFYSFNTKNNYNTEFISCESFTTEFNGTPRIINYSYNNTGFISGISSTLYGFGHQYTYSYNRLISDNSVRFGNLEYLYDEGGNITSIKRDGITIYTFSYNDLYQITSITHPGGTYTFAYDYRGCPTTYKDKTVLFSDGMLKSFDGISFKYNSYGQRIRKYSDSFSTNYVYQLGKMIYEIRYVNNVKTTIEYIHGVKGIVGFIYNHNYYIYHRNILGDIVAIYLGTSLVAKYDYDAWGNHVVLNPDGTENTSPTFIGNVNPFRYRGYYYDTETHLYYLKTRYYDSDICRFISADNIKNINSSIVNGTNLYIYCNNNPMTYVDHTGQMAVWAIGMIAGAIIGAIIGGAYGGLTAASTGANGWQIVGAIGIGALVGGIMGAGAGFGSAVLTSGISGVTAWSGAAWGIGVSASALTGSLGGFTMDTLSQIMYHTKVRDWESVGWSSLQGCVINVVSMLSTSIGGGAGSFWDANLAMNAIMGFPVSSVSFAVDMFRYYVWVSEEEKERRRRRRAFAWLW